LSISSKDKIAEYWSKNVPGWDRINYTSRINEPYISPLLEEMNSTKKILEVGCGLGIDTYWLYKYYNNITAVDLSQSNVDRVKKIVPNGKILCADAENLPFVDNSFDIYYSFGVLHHTPDTQKAINEARRVLRPGGKCIIMLYHKGYAWWYLKWFKGGNMNLYDNTPLTKMFSKEEVKQMFKDWKDVNLEMTTFRGSNGLWRILERNKFLMDRFGQYIIIRGGK
jgi:ubiquinone/menaquinone biosynthesis C-methylase UbiE